MIESIATSLRNNDAGIDFQSNLHKKSKEEVIVSSVDNCDTKCQESERLENEENICCESVCEKSSIEKEEGGAQSCLKDEEKKEAISTEVCDEKVPMVEGKTRVITEEENNDDLHCAMRSNNEALTRNVNKEVLGSSGEEDKVPGCTECQINHCNPTPAELTMCLHAAVYKVKFCINRS